nr:hypothetical protein [uncultured Clostridium sp.]
MQLQADNIKTVGLLGMHWEIMEVYDMAHVKANGIQIKYEIFGKKQILQ